MCFILRNIVRVCTLLVICFETNYGDLDLNILYHLYKQSLQLRKAEKPWDDGTVRTSNLDHDLNETLFNSLEGYQVGATPAKESNYLWIAKVVHSRSEQFIPYMCTAVCVEERIFMTAARCIYSLKVDYTTIIYKNQPFPAQAFVLPSNQSKQLFDDIGLIVVGTVAFSEKWTKAKLFQGNRTGSNFQWFADLGISSKKAEYKVVGYTTEKGLHRIKAANREFTLSELPVIIDIKMCSKIYTLNYNIRGFFVPCYHSCTQKEFEEKDDKCNNYLGVEGGAIVNIKTGVILGVATWGAHSSKCELPVGFSVANSKAFFKDLLCATHIRNDDALLLVRGFYQSLCENAFK